MSRARELVVAGALIAAIGLVFWWVVSAALRGQPSTARCAPGVGAGKTRCCGAGQREVGGVCEGTATACTSAQELSEGQCVAAPRRVRVEGGTLDLTATDWEPGVLSKQSRHAVVTLEVDAFEVTEARWQKCATAGRCATRNAPEHGLPVRNVSAKDAIAFCAFEGGRLPTELEWRFIAAGVESRRFPWGQTGLVCRRAAYGLATGPCARGGTGPELAGSRPDGATKTGVHDLAGNVAEWVIDERGQAGVLGGSYRSSLAGELKTLGRLRHPESLDDVGFRCVYSAPGAVEPR